jgi:hypothetical protein
MRQQTRLALPDQRPSPARAGRASPKAPLARLQDAAESAPPVRRQMALQRLADGRSALPAVAGTAPIQRSVDTAAQALFNAGTITVKNRDLSKKFCTDHAVTKGDLDAIQTALDALRAANPREVHEIVDMTDQANWPTSGGMVEGDGADVAGVLGWTQDGGGWKCSDPGHTPKGKVYVDGSGNYFGADNTGHVGWGFKVWLKKNKTTLDYAGNYSWDGAQWVHDARGTGRAMK